MGAEVLRPGKLPPDLLTELIGARASEEVLVGPAVGEDGCAIRIADDILVAATDPITLTGSGVGRHAVIINANDVAVMGATPRWFLANVLLPVGTTADEARALFDAMHAELDHLNVALVGGHTEVSAAVNQPLVVGQMLGLVGPQGLTKTGGLSPGDFVVQIGPAPVEGAFVLAQEFAERLDTIPSEQLQEAANAIEHPGISVVEAALAAGVCGACAMHDPTEGGLAAGLHELALASGVSIRVDPARVLWFEPGRAIATVLGLDPWGLLASGALLAGFSEHDVETALNELTGRGFGVVVIGEVFEGTGVTWVDGAPVPKFDRDELSRLFEAEAS